MAAKTPTQAPAAVISPARESLRQVLEAQRRAKALLDKAQAVAADANKALETARADVARYAEANGDVVQARLAALKGTTPAKSQEELKESRRNRLLAIEEAESSEMTLKAAQGELAEFHGNVARAEKVAASHCTAVLGECVTDAIALWDKVNAERERLRTVLNALILANVHLDALAPAQQANILHGAAVKAGLPFGDVMDWRNLQNRIGAALSHNYQQADPGPSTARAREFWSKYSEALLSDPGAELPQLPTSEQLFS